MPRRLTGRGTAGHLGGEKAQAHGSHVAPHVARVRPRGRFCQATCPPSGQGLGCQKPSRGRSLCTQAWRIPLGHPNPSPCPQVSRGCSPAGLLTVTMRPPAERSRGSSPLVSSSEPKKFTSMQVRKLPSGESSASAMMSLKPALFTKPQRPGGRGTLKKAAQVGQRHAGAAPPPTGTLPREPRGALGQSL